MAFSGNEFTAGGLQNAETIGTVTLTSAGTPAAASAGAYSIVPGAPVGGTFAAGNYTNTFVNGTLTVLAPPTPALATHGSQCVLSFPTLAGQTYQVLATTNLANASWAALGNTIIGTGAMVNQTNIITTPASFFELQITP